MKRIRTFASLMSFAFLGGSLHAGPVFQHVEPPYWWTGMKNPALQIMMHGENIAANTVTVKYPGLVIDSIVKPANPNYLILYLTLSPLVKPGSFNIVLTGQGNVTGSYAYQLLEREKGYEKRKGFSPEDVIYLITPDRFANGDPSNDNQPGMIEKADRTNPDGRHGGDLKGILSHLDYIESMGFTALWINPVVENNQPKYSYHGYSTTDFYRIDPRFGTMDDYLTLSREASKRGIKLIMDQIMNHCGSGHWWMKDMPYPDWLRTPMNAGPTNHRRTTQHDPYAMASDRAGYEKGWFVTTMPDMNQDNVHLANYLIQNSIWWIEQAELRGIRHDTHSYVGPEFMEKWTCAIMNEYPGFNIVGEEWSENPAVIAKWQRGYQGPANMHSCLPSLMDFPLQTALSGTLARTNRLNDEWIPVYEMLGNDFLYPDPFNLVIFPDNHDMDRFYTKVQQDISLYRLGIAFFLTTRGIPQIFYGTEMLLTNAVLGNDGLRRGDFPGGWSGDSVNGFTGQGISSDQKIAQEFMKKLLNWRKGSDALRHGLLRHYAPFSGVYVYFRYTDQQKVMVILNKNSNTVEIETKRFAEMLDPSDTFKDIITGRIFSGGKIEVEGKTPLILEVK